MEYLDTKYFSYANPEDSFPRKAFIRSIEFFSGQPKLYNLYRNYQNQPENWEDFWDGCIDILELNVKYDEEKISEKEMNKYEDKFRKVEEKAFKLQEKIAERQHFKDMKNFK